MTNNSNSRQDETGAYAFVRFSFYPSFRILTNEDLSYPHRLADRSSLKSLDYFRTVCDVVIGYHLRNDWWFCHSFAAQVDCASLVSLGSGQVVL